jgi:hypothetical protein
MKIRDLVALSSILVLGISLTAYAHTHFSTKIEVEQLRNIVERIDDRVYLIYLNAVGD